MTTIIVDKITKAEAKTIVKVIAAKIKAAQPIIHAKIKHAMIAGVVMFTMNLAITQLNDVSRNKYLVKKGAAVMYLSTIKCNAADTCLSITLRHAAVKSVNTMMLMNAKLVKNGFAINIANMCQNTIGNMSAVIKVAQLLVQKDNVYTEHGSNRITPI